MSNSNQLMARLAQLSPEQREALLKKLQQQKQTSSTPSSAIPVQPRDQGLPLSFSQQRLWFLQQLEGPSSTYNIAAAIRLKGALDIEALRQTIETIVSRHEILRTVFVEEHGQALQRIANASRWLLPLEDLSQLPTEKRAAIQKERVRDAAQKPFDIAQGPLLRTSLLKLGEQEHILLTTMHHIIGDGWSVRVLLREINAIYGALCRHEDSPLPPLAIQYADFATWQRHYFDDNRLAPQLDYWRHQLGGVEVLELPTDRPRPAQMSYRGNYYQFSLPKPVIDGLNRLSQQHGATLFMTLLAAFKVLLARYSGQHDICVGSPIANRTRSDIEPLIGLFVNSLALRSHVDVQQTFVELLKRLQKTTLDAYANQDVPFERLVDVLGVARDTSHSPLFQVFFTLTNGEAERNLQLDNLNAEFLPADIDSAKFDLSLLTTEYRDRLVCQLEYASDLFDRDTIVRMALHFSELVSAIVSNPMTRIGRLPLLDKDELQQLLVDWNQTTRQYPHTTITSQIETQTTRTPDAIAVRCGKQTLSYAQLNQRADTLAAALQQHGVVRGDRVGLCLPRSLDLITAVVATLKCGAAYVPMDTSYPADRLQHMADNAGMKLLLTHSSLRAQMPKHNGSTHAIDDIDLSRHVLPAATETDADDLLYVVYTSGSTGLPKGAGVLHRNESNLLQWYLREYNIAPDDRVLVISAFGFDLTQKNLLGPLVAGACIVLPENDHYDHLEALNLIRQHNVTLLNCAPSAFYPVVAAAEKPEHLQSLRVVLFGGEPIRMENLARWFEHDSYKANIVNMYGPTECTDIAASYTVTQPQDFLTRAVPVGRPNDNVKLYVLDELLQPVPVGVVGELYIGGDGVGCGYINNDALTAEKFVRNPFAHGLMYRSGDLVRFRFSKDGRDGKNGGNIEFVSRADGQVKVRGFRIELGEIEAQLNRHPDVSESVVTAVNGNTGAVLVAYVVGKTCDANAIQLFLRQHLPEYMVPSAIVQIDRIPLTPNGKVDRKALPQPDLSQIGRKPYVAPRNGIETELCTIWQQLLNADNLGVHDNFFEVGGHSLLATQLITRIRDRFALELPLKTLFDMPTIAGLAELIQSLAPASGESHSLSSAATDSDEDFEEGIL